MSELPKGFVVASHSVLFEDAESFRCDVCAEHLRATRTTPSPSDSDADEGYDVQGRGLLVWTRGDERRYQEPPLCPTCAAAIGVSALQRWEIEEEEG